MAPRDFFIGLGSNIDPLVNVPKMLDGLLQLAPEVAISPIAITEPVNLEGAGHAFLNVAARLRTAGSDRQVKDLLNAIEIDLGRDRSDPRSKVRDRCADLDILFAVPVGTRVVPASCGVPQEAYLRPQLDALLAYLGMSVEGAAPPVVDLAAMRTVALDLHGVIVGRASLTLHRPPIVPLESA